LYRIVIACRDAFVTDAKMDRLPKIARGHRGACLAC
jgi:hypothetical protein